MRAQSKSLRVNGSNQTFLLGDQMNLRDDDHDTSTINKSIEFLPAKIVYIRSWAWDMEINNILMFSSKAKD
jgi:hypothetical protein